MGYKKKEEIREQARIECKFLVNEAKIRFVEVKDDPKAMTELYVWLNQEVKKLQLSQADTYFSVHNMGGLTTVTQVKE